MVPLQLKDLLELFVKSKEFLESDIKKLSLSTA